MISPLQKNAVIDCRVSGTKQLTGSSLDTQESIGRIKADQLGANVVKVFRKPHSATTTEREDFLEVVEYIKSRVRKGLPPVHYYIIKSIDRLTREGYIEYTKLKYELESLGVKVIDSEGVIQDRRNTLEHLGDYKYKWSDYSPSEAGEMLESYKSKAEARDILTRMIGAEIGLVLDGYSVRRAPDGLKNKVVIVDGQEKVVRERGERAHFFEKMFNLLADGMGYPEVVENINAMGFRTQKFKHWDRSDKEHPKVIGQKGGKPLTVKQLQRYIQQTEYAGINCEKWTKHRPIRMKQFDGIVSIDTFNKANRGKIFIKVNADKSIEVIRNYSPWGKVKRLRDRSDYPFKFLPCAICGRNLLGSAPLNKMKQPSPRYHCGGTPSRKHAYYSIARGTFEANVRKYLETLRFDEAFLNSFELVLNDTFRTREKEIVSESSNISLNVGDLKAQQAATLDTLTTTQSAVARRKLEERIDELEAQIQQAQIKRAEIEVTEKDIKEFIKYAKYLMEHPADLLMDPHDLHVQRSLFGLVFEKTPTYEEILNGTPKLSLVFKLSQEFSTLKTQTVTLPGVEPGFKA